MRSPRQVIRIPLRCIDRAYGPDKLDDAADDLVYCLRQVSEFPDQFNFELVFDRNHANPWYHGLVFFVEGIGDEACIRMLELIAGYGLEEVERDRE